MKHAQAYADACELRRQDVHDTAREWVSLKVGRELAKGRGKAAKAQRMYDRGGRALKRALRHLQKVSVKEISVLSPGQ